MSISLADAEASTGTGGTTALSNREEGRLTSTSLASVLLVGDEPGMGHFLRKALARRFGLVQVAKDAETLRRRCHFDLVITDIRLPGMSGVEWVQEIRA